MPALLTSTSIGPTSSSIRATAAPTAARSVTSNAAACAFAPDAPNSATTFSTLAASRPLTTTVAPAPARPRASARPMPADEPVTSATVCGSANRRSISLVTDASFPLSIGRYGGGAAATIAASRREGQGDNFVGGGRIAERQPGDRTQVFAVRKRSSPAVLMDPASAVLAPLMDFASPRFFDRREVHLVAGETGVDRHGEGGGSRKRADPDGDGGRPNGEG